MEEGENQGYVRVSFRNAHNVNVVDTNPNESGVTLCEDWLQGTFVQFEDFTLEAFGDARSDVAAIVSRDDDFAFLI